MQPIEFVAVASLAASTFWTANDPFVGKWRLDVSRSTIVDEMRVQALSPNKYQFSFEGAPIETIIADGTDQPGLPGTTLSVSAPDPQTMLVVRKQDGRTIVSAIWNLSHDGSILHDDFTSLQPDGSKTTVHYLYKRISGTTGFAGQWESTTKPIGLKVELGIQPYDNKGLSFVSPGSKRSVIFDGRDHPVAGATADLTLTGRRRGNRVIENVEQNQGKLEHARRFEVAPDGRTLTETVRTPGQTLPNVLVFERE